MLRVDAVNIICIIINLLILLAAMKKFLFGPVEKIMEARRAEADALLEEVREKEQAAREQKEQYETSLIALEEEKKQVLAEAKAEAEEQCQVLLDHAKLEAAQIREHAAVEAEAERSEMMRHTREEIADMVVDAAGKVAGRARGEEADRALYDEFLNKVGEEA